MKPIVLTVVAALVAGTIPMIGNRDMPSYAQSAVLLLIGLVAAFEVSRSYEHTVAEDKRKRRLAEEAVLVVVSDRDSRYVDRMAFATVTEDLARVKAEQKEFDEFFRNALRQNAFSFPKERGWRHDRDQMRRIIRLCGFTGPDDGEEMAAMLDSAFDPGLPEQT